MVSELTRHVKETETANRQQQKLHIVIQLQWMFQFAHSFAIHSWKLKRQDIKYLRISPLTLLWWCIIWFSNFRLNIFILYPSFLDGSRCHIHWWNRLVRLWHLHSDMFSGFRYAVNNVKNSEWKWSKRLNREWIPSMGGRFGVWYEWCDLLCICKCY